MIESGVGVSELRNPFVAGADAAKRAKEELGEFTPDLAVVFSTVHYDQKTLLEGIRSELPNVDLVGCSAEGIISGSGSIEGTHACVVALIQSEELKFTVVLAENLREHPTDAGKTIADSVNSCLANGLPALGLFLFPDGLTINFDEFNRGFGEVIENQIPMFGGTAADNWTQTETFQYHNDRVISDSISAVFVQGNATIGTAITHGCVALGTERVVTRAEKNVIFEIDHKPALDVLAEYLSADELNDWERVWVNLTVGFKPESDAPGFDEYVVRYLVNRDTENGSFSIATNVVNGTKVWMQRRDFDKIRNGLTTVRKQMGDVEPKFVFQFDCAGRGKVMFKNDEKQLLHKELRATVAPHASWIGFHSYGEIGPVNGENHFHNYTAVFVAVG